MIKQINVMLHCFNLNPLLNSSKITNKCKSFISTKGGNRTHKVSRKVHFIIADSLEQFKAQHKHNLLLHKDRLCLIIKNHDRGLSCGLLCSVSDGS